MALRGGKVPARTSALAPREPVPRRSPNPASEDEAVAPLRRLAEHAVPADVAYQLVHDELLLDGSARLNLATFVTTWMEPQADRLMAESVDKNMIDKDEYPQTAAIENRCVAILSDLWHAPGGDVATGCSTTGSSEACMLAGMALKRRWAARTGNDPARKPNLVMGANVQVCWEKFCRYWDVEPRLVPIEGTGCTSARSRRWRTATRTRSASSRSWVRPSTAATSRWPTSPPRWTSWPRAADRTCPSTSTEHPGR